jgi:non-homologous end joining protein Ku
MGNVVNLMDALRASIKDDGQRTSAIEKAPRKLRDRVHNEKRDEIILPARA